MEKAHFYNYLSETVVSLDNAEVIYSLYKTDEGEALLLLANCGGPRLDDSPSIGVNVTLNLEALKLPETLRCWRMKGNTYETFRIAEIDPVKEGFLSVYEIDHHEFQGYILSPNEPPETLVRLQRHLEGMPKRLSALLERKRNRLRKLDQQLDAFAKEPHAHVFSLMRSLWQGVLLSSGWRWFWSSLRATSKVIDAWPQKSAGMEKRFC